MVERATSNVAIASFFKRHSGIDHIDNVGATQYFIDKMLGDFPSHVPTIALEKSPIRFGAAR